MVMAKLEEVLAKEELPSDDVKETTEDTTEPVDTVEEEEVEPAEKAEVEPEVEKEPDIESRIRSEADKRVRSYQDKLEVQNAYVRDLKTRLAEAKRASNEKTSGSMLKSLLDGFDEEGYSEEQKQSFQERIVDYNKKIAEYNENSTIVNEISELITNWNIDMPKSLIEEFDLDNPNPTLMVKNRVGVLSETIGAIKYNQDFLLVMEHFLPNGDEVRKEIEGIVKELSSDPELNTEKSKRLFLKDKMRGIRKPVAKKPPAPSDSSGGDNFANLPIIEKIERGLAKMDKP